MGEHVGKIDGREVRVHEKSLPLSSLHQDSAGTLGQPQPDANLGGINGPESPWFVNADMYGQYERFRDYLEREGGILNPIWVTPARDGCYVVVEGRVRLQAYLDLRHKCPDRSEWQTVPAYILSRPFSRQQMDAFRREAGLWAHGTAAMGEDDQV